MLRSLAVACLALSACGRIAFDPLAGDAASSGDAAPGDPYRALTDPSAWTMFDLTSVDPAANGFYGAVFANGYVFMVPNDNAIRDGVVTRYDPQQPFAAPGSWSTFDLGTLSANEKGFFGGVTDDSYLYLAPFDNGIGGPDGWAARYDLHQPLGSTAAWSTFDLTTLDPNAKGLWSAAFDGKFLYLAPFSTDNGPDGVVARYDTTAAFATAASWSVFDIASLDPGAVGFAGAAFDGRFIYFAPRNSGVVARYDTQAALASAAAWSFYDLTTIDAGAQGFDGTVFDGRYVYLVPCSRGAAASGVIARVDTRAAQFASPAAWDIFDITTLDPNAKGFVGAAFDGRYIYLPPDFGTVAARFEARSAAAFPPRLGSFF